MTVSTEVSREEYTGNGVTTDFDYRFRVFSAEDLVVSVADTTETISVLTLNTDYTVTGAGSRTGGKVKLLSPLAFNWRISIERALPVTQETDIRNQGNFFPEVHEDAFDKLTMLIQQVWSYFGLALRKPTWLAKFYDAQGNRIANLGNPINAQDAATKSYVDVTGDSWFKRTLRVPESFVNELPPVSGRRRKIHAYDDSGQPLMVLPESGSAADVMIELAQFDGLKNIGSCPDVATLRTVEPTSPNQQIYVLRHSAGNTVSLRRYYYHQPDTTSLDDNGRVIVTAGGKRWKLLFDDGYLTPEVFGAVGDAVFSMITNTATGTDNTTAFQNMFNSASAIGCAIKLPDAKKYLSGSLYLYKDAVLNPNWPSRPGRIYISGMSTGHATGDVENVGAAIIHKPGQTTPLISLVGGFSEATPTGTGGYFQLERLNLVGSPNTSDVLLLQGSQGSIYLANYTVKVTNPAGNGITQSTVWEIAHLNGLIRGGATGDGSWTGIGLNIKADGSNGQTNMSVYTNVDCYKMGYGIRIGRRDKTQGTLGPIVFNGGQTSLADQHGIWLDGGVIAFTSIGQQHEGARKNGIRIDNNLEGGVVSSDISRNIKFINTYITECGRVEDGTGDSYAIYVVNGDGIEFDTPVFNNVGNGIVFSSGTVDNLLIRRPTFRTVRAFGLASGYGIRAFGVQNPVKRQYLEHPVFNQSPQTQIDSLALEIFNRGDAGGRISFSNPAITAVTIHLGAQTGLEPARQINFNYQEPVTITNILGGRQFQELLITFSNNLVTIPNNHSAFYLNGNFTPTSSKSTLRLFYDGVTWNEISRSLN